MRSALRISGVLPENWIEDGTKGTDESSPHPGAYVDRRLVNGRLDPVFNCGYSELLSSGLPTGSCQMEAAKASGATPNWLALAGSGKWSLWGDKGGARAKAASTLRRELS